MKQFSLCIVLFLFAATAINGQSMPLLVPYLNGEKWGFADSNGRVKIKPQWDVVECFANGRAKVFDYSHTRRRVCIIDTAGHYIVPPWREWNGTSYNKSNLGSLNARGKNGKWGIIDENNNEIIPCVYELTDWRPIETHGSGTFYYDTVRHKKYAVAKKNGKFGLIDTANRTIIPFQYDGFFRPHDPCTPREYFIVDINGKQGIIDTNNTLIVPALYDHILFNWPDLKKGIALWLGNRRLIADISGKIVLDIPDYMVDFPEDTFIRVNALKGVASKHGSAGLMNQRQEIVIPCEYSIIRLRKDTIEVVIDSMLPGVTYGHWYKKYFDRRTYKPMSEWLTDEIVTPPASRANLNAGPVTLTPTPQALPEEEYQYPMTLHGETVKSFELDGIRWKSSGYFKWPKLYQAVTGISTGGDSTHYAAVVDTAGRYICLPFRTAGTIKYINTHDSLIVVEQRKSDSFQCVTDYRGKKYLQWQSTAIDGAFFYHGVFYAVKNTTPVMRSGGEFPFQGTVYDRYAEQAHEIVTSDGKPIPGLQHLNIRSSCNEYGINTCSMERVWYAHELFTDAEEPNFKGYFIATNNESKTGIVNITGDTAYRAVSFKYNSLTPCGQGIFQVANEDPNRRNDIPGYITLPSTINGKPLEIDERKPLRGMPYLVNAENKVLLDSMTIDRVEQTTMTSDFKMHSLYPIFNVFLKAPKGYNYGASFYMNARGHGYYGKLPKGVN